MFRPVDSNEVQIEGFQVVHHMGDDPTQTVNQVQIKLARAFSGETAHKTVRLITNGKVTTFFVETGNEDVLVNQVTEHVMKAINTLNYPVRFEFQNFLAYTKPTTL
jgi:hypothetical protein